MSSPRQDGDSSAVPKDQRAPSSQTSDSREGVRTTLNLQPLPHSMPLFLIGGLSNARGIGKPPCGQARLATHGKRCEDCERVFMSDGVNLTCNDIIAYFCKRFLVLIETANTLNDEDFVDGKAKLRKLCGIEQ